MSSEPKNLRVVLDTNVLISCLVFHKETRVIWDLVEEGRFDLFLSSFILSELRRVLMRKLNLSIERVNAIVDWAESEATEIVFPERRVSAIINDDSDNGILECAVEAKTDVIVTGDIKHIRPLGSFEGILILTPREFMDKYFPSA